MRSYAVMLCLLSAPSFAVAADVSIHTMIAGNRVFEIDDIRQLTFRADGVIAGSAISPDAKYVAYIAEVGKKRNLCLVKSSGGSSTVVTGGTPPWTAQGPRAVSEAQWVPSGSIAWSPDSQRFAVSATRYAPRSSSNDDQGSDAQNLLLLFSRDGALRATIPVGGRASLSDIQFSPDSRKIAAVTSVDEPGSNRDELVVFDIATGQALPIYTHQGHYLTLMRWPDQRFVLCSVWDAGCNRLLRVSLDVGEPEVLAEDYSSVVRSPDGRFRADRREGSMTIKDTQTGTTVRLPEVEENEISGWLPNRSFLYRQNELIQDKTRIRSRRLQTLWLGTLSEGKCNTMCIALDCCGDPTWSADSKKIAYVSGDRLHLVSLSTREPTLAERMADGQRLTEDQEKAIMLEHGRRIGLELQCQICSFTDSFPSSKTTTEEIMERFGRSKEIYFRPGTEQVIFRYFPSDVLRESDREARRTTIVGELDAGYDWRVVIYGDGRAEIDDR